MLYNRMMKISPKELYELDIPMSITEEKLKDSGYTYRFAKHKALIKKLMAEDLLGDIKFEFRKTEYGVELVGMVYL